MSRAVLFTVRAGQRGLCGANAEGSPASLPHGALSPLLAFVSKGGWWPDSKTLLSPRVEGLVYWNVKAFKESCETVGSCFSF